MQERSRFEHEIDELREAVGSGLTFRVVGVNEQPIVGARYSIHQDDVTDSGVLSSTGEAQFQKVDPSRPFRLHVDGRVCAIVEGAVLLADDPAVEYGGQFVDWRMADDPQKGDKEFWPHYTAERKAKAEGPSTFLQHDHIMRRPIRLRTSYRAPGKVAVFQAFPLRLRLGPLVRFVDGNRALIWVELETPGLVQVRVRRADDQVGVPKPGKTLREIGIVTKHATTVRVGGRHFALVRVDGLDEDTVYQYTLDLAPVPATGQLPRVEFEFSKSGFPQTLPADVEAAQAKQLATRSFRGDRWLFFRTLRPTFERLRFAHGSCRKWPNDTDQDKRTPGPDMLGLFGSEWLAKQQVWSEWPRFFLHTGDQIYADDVGVIQGDRILKQRFGSILPGPSKGGTLVEGAWAGRFAVRYVLIGPSQTAKLAAPTRALRARVNKLKPELDKAMQSGHLDQAVVKKAREYLDARKALDQEPGSQRAWKFVDPKRPIRFRHRIENGLLWNIPYEKAGIPEVTLLGLRHRGADKSYYPSAGETNAVHVADFAEYAYLYQKAWSTSGTKKVLAHLPSFMIFDDHEITDDWNFNAKWVEMVHDKQDFLQMWPTTITDALVAYWMYQGWGNVSPDLWGSDRRIRILHDRRADGRDALPELRELIFDSTVKPARQITAAGQRLVWHYALPIKSPQFLVVDDRTEREVFGPGGPFRSQLAWLRKRFDEERGPVAFVVFATPYLMPHPISWALTHQKETRAINFFVQLFSLKWDWKTIEQLARDSDMEHAAGNHVWDEFKEMLEKLQDSVTSLKTIAFLSGDIHFSCNLDGQLKKDGQTIPPHLLQLVSSGLRQSITPAKQSQLKTAYKYLGFNTTGAHRGLTVRLAGLDGPDRDDPNFLFPTSVALVDVDVRQYPGDARIQGDELANVAIRQQHLTWNAKAKPKRVDTYDFSYSNNEATGPKMTPGRQS